jgi:hypothetical protein
MTKFDPSPSYWSLWLTHWRPILNRVDGVELELP